MEKENLKEECIELFLDGKSYTEIAKLTNHSRNYIANLIRDDNRVKEKLNTRTVKVYKLKNCTRMKISISTDFLSKIGISKDNNKDEYVEINLDEENKTITIKKKNDM